MSTPQPTPSLTPTVTESTQTPTEPEPTPAEPTESPGENTSSPSTSFIKSILLELNTQMDFLIARLNSMFSSDPETATSKRNIIWKAYLSKLNMIGNTPERFEYNGEILNYNAHNAVLEVAYQNGLIAGILFLFINVYMAVKSVMFFIKKRGSCKYALLPLLVTCGYLFTANLSSFSQPFIYNLSFAYYMILAPLFVSMKDNVPQNGDTDPTVQV